MIWTDRGVWAEEQGRRGQTIGQRLAVIGIHTTTTWWPMTLELASSGAPCGLEEAGWLLSVAKNLRLQRTNIHQLPPQTDTHTHFRPQLWSHNCGLAKLEPPSSPTHINHLYAFANDNIPHGLHSKISSTNGRANGLVNHTGPVNQPISWI